MSNQDKVSLCMITKNEENCINCCINSVRHLIDEVVVVDTGSTDHTVARALQMGAKVFHYTWQGNFAMARNFAIEQATGNWILVLDADEIIAYVSPEKFQGLLGNSQIEGYLIDIESYIGNGEEKIFDQVVRLFRNKEHYRFAGAIHEQVVGSIRQHNQGKGLGLASADFKIIHSGYLASRIEEKNKHIRNIAVIKQALQNHSSDPFLHYSLAMEYIQQGKIIQANEELGKSLQQLTGGEGYFPSVLVNLASGLLQLGKFKEGENLIDQALTLLPQDSNLLLLKGMAAFYQRDYSVSIGFFHQSLVGKEDKIWISSIHSLCGDLYSLMERYGQAEEEYFRALQGSPQHLYPLLQLIGLRQKEKGQGSWYELSQFATRDENKELQFKLMGMKEVHLVIVLALFNIVNAQSGDWATLMIACNEYLQAIRGYEPRDELGKKISTYLHDSGQLMLLYSKGGMANLGCDLFRGEGAITGIANENLTVISKTLCPTWIPCLALHQFNK